MSNFKCQISNKRKLIINNVNFWQKQAGFTLIELLIVFSLMIIISVVSFASFSSYNTSQKFTTAALDLKNALEYAKSQTISQVNTCSSGQQFIGYKVLMCCQGNQCPVCLSNKSYEVDEVCSGGASFVSGGNLSQGVTVDTTNSTSFSFQFTALSENVTGAGTLVLKQGTALKNIVVSSTGVIQ